MVNHQYLVALLVPVKKLICYNVKMIWLFDGERCYHLGLIEAAFNAHARDEKVRVPFLSPGAGEWLNESSLEIQPSLLLSKLAI